MTLCLVAVNYFLHVFGFLDDDEVSINESNENMNGVNADIQL